MRRATRVLVLIGFVALLNLPGGCNKVDLAVNVSPNAVPAREPVADDAITAHDAIAANRDFAVDLYHQLAKEHAGRNLFFSPYSVSSALAIAVEGARGETAAQMGNVLRFTDAARQVGTGAESIPWNTELIHSGMATLNQRFGPKPIPEELRDQIATLRKNLNDSNQQVAELEKATKRREAFQASEKGKKLAAELNAILSRVDQYEIRVANALWGEETYPFEPSYLETIRRFYGNGAVFPVDFKDHAESARQQINAWVAEQTNARIRDLIPPGGVDSLTRLVLTNAIYFKGEWMIPFPERSTRKDDFTIAGGAKVQVLMMHEDYKHDVRYAAFNANGTFFPTPKEVPDRRVPDPKTVYPDKNGFLMLELPYKGRELSMVAIVPQNADGLAELEQKLSSDDLQKWMSELQHRDAHVDLPKFKLETEYTLKPTLIAMGMSRAFDNRVSPNEAQFEGMCASQDSEQQLSITEVMHKAFVEVNEKGTEAAAATELSMGVSDGSFEEPTIPFTPIFRADKPFLFLIREIKTGTILFFGRIIRPQE